MVPLMFLGDVSLFEGSRTRKQGQQKMSKLFKETTIAFHWIQCMIAANSDHCFPSSHYRQTRVSKCEHSCDTA